MATPLARRRRIRRESNAHAIARRLEAENDSAAASLKTIRAPWGTTVGHYLIPGSRNVASFAMTAAAEVIHGGATVGQKIKRAPTQGWQQDVWDLRAVIGEFRFSGDRVARAVSQCRLFIARLPDAADADPEPVTTGPLFELQQMMFGNKAHVQQELKRAAQHLVFNGESLLLIRQDQQRLTWGAHSVTEITGQGDAMKLNDGVNSTDLSDNDMVVRAWTPDPQRGGLADCPARSVLPVARELEGLTKHTGAQIDSRLAGAGLLVLPQSVEVMAGQASTPQEGDEDAEMDEFVRALVESMTVPLRDRDSAASLVPLTIRVPDDAVDKIQHITFASPFDAQAKDLREENIRRLALGMDSDPSVLLGLGGGNHWSAWLVSEDESTLVVSPVAATLCHGLTTGFLRPIMAQVAPEEDANQYLVWFDLSELQLRPDKSADARAMWADGLLSNEAALRENGFDATSDSPDTAEYTKRLLEKLLLAKPDYAPAILPALGIDLALPSTPEPEPQPAAEPEPEPADEDGQDRELPDTEGDPPPASQPREVPRS